MGSDGCRLVRIADAMAYLNQKVNIVGVVMESTLPRKTKGTDFFCSVRIVDESQPSLGMYVHFFAETVEKLPHVESVGDIIMVSRVDVKTWDSQAYAQFNKKYSSFALFEGRVGSSKEFVPYLMSSRFKARGQDKKLVTELREWGLEHKIDGLDELVSLREIKEDTGINLFCKILHVCEFNKDEWIIFVWDGTDTPPASVDSKLEDERENPLPLQLEPSSLSRDVLCTFPPAGSVLRMIFDQGSDKIGIKVIKTNRWVKVVNIKCEVRAGLWRAVLIPSSKLGYLPEDNDSVVKRQRDYDKLVQSNFGKMPVTSFPCPSNITETDHPDVPFLTLMNVLTHPEVTCKFKCVVRVVAIFPWRAEDFLSPKGIYRVRLTLEDPTARIHAFLYAEDGAKFFGKFHNTSDMLTKKRNLLLGVAEKDRGAMAVDNDSRNPPWIQCCLKSYYIDDADPWGSRNFRVFDTRFVG